MIELTRVADDNCRFGYGGDSLNTAVYLARLGVPVDYMTALGTDSLSDWLCQAWQEEGVGLTRVVRLSGRQPGLYLIETDAHGERSFSYWREASAARFLLSDLSSEALTDTLRQYELIYLTGVSLAIYPDADREKLLAALRRARSAGVRVAFDSNYRASVWQDPARAAAAMNLAFETTDIALVGETDFHVYPDIRDDADIFSHLGRRDVPEIVLRKGTEGAEGRSDAGSWRVPAQEVVEVVDTTAAGDSFNAAYLAARLAGDTPEEAGQQGCQLAAQVIQHCGAIAPREEAPRRLRGVR